MNMLMEWLEPKVQQRVGEIGLMITNTKSYQKNSDQYNNLFHEILNALPEEKRDLLFELDAMIGTMESELAEQMYRAGLKDGFNLAKDIQSVLFVENTSKDEKWIFPVQNAS